VWGASGSVPSDGSGAKARRLNEKNATPTRQRNPHATLRGQRGVTFGFPDCRFRFTPVPSRRSHCRTPLPHAIARHNRMRTPWWASSHTTSSHPFWHESTRLCTPLKLHVLRQLPITAENRGPSFWPVDTSETFLRDPRFPLWWMCRCPHRLTVVRGEIRRSWCAAMWHSRKNCRQIYLV
jgi:hypothetical protein